MPAPRLLLVSSLLFSTAAANLPLGKPPPMRRLIVVLLAVGVLLDLLVSAVLVNNYRQIQEVTSEAHIAKVAAYESCLDGNRAKQADADRWAKVLALIDTMPTNPQVEAFITGVGSANASADHPADCQTLMP
jgi:hypothetical protein